uniref:RPA43 OB domain-containing protein n=1 Tax=Anopheles dirus TaxID=7168 RepID=A0A182N3P8_9DIPT
MNRTTIAKYTKFSAEELQQSVSDPLSCVAAVQLNEILSLRPRDCEHIVKGVRRCVTDKIGQYHPKLGGIVLGYAKIRIDNALSALRLDSPYLHVRATIDYFVFQPLVDRKLRGTVNYVSKGFVCAVLYRVFNVTVKLVQKGMKNVTKGSEIAFIVRSCNMRSEIPVIEGELVDTDGGVDPLGIKQEPGVKKRSNNVVKMEEVDEEEEEEMDEEDQPQEKADAQEERQLPSSTEETETVDSNVPVVVKQEPKTPKQSKKQKQKESAPSVPTVANGLAAAAASESDSDSNDEQSLRIKSLLGQVFGKEFTSATSSSRKKQKSKQKKSPEKSSTATEAISIKQEILSDAEDISSEQNGSKFTPNGYSTPAPHVNGVNGTGKKRKIQFDLTPTVSHIKTEPTESRKKKKKSE